MADISELTAQFSSCLALTPSTSGALLLVIVLKTQASSAGYRTSIAGAGSCLANVCHNSPNISLLACNMSLFLLIGADTGMKTSSIKQQLTVTSVSLCTSTWMLKYACPSKLNNLSLPLEKH